MRRNYYLWGRIVFTTVALLLLIIRWFYFDLANRRMDTTFILLFVAAILIFVLPWERLSSFKAGGIEVSIDKPEVKAALANLNLDRVDDEQLKEELKSLALEIDLVRGGRILWIDDYPHKLVSERRLLRSLGIEIISTNSSEDAENILMKDNDFDMIISDVQRVGQSYKFNNGIDIHEGVNFIVKLRQNEDPIIQSIPVIFYAAYEWEKLVKFTRPAREQQPDAELSNTPKMLIVKIIRTLSYIRLHPVKKKGKKDPTHAR